MNRHLWIDASAGVAGDMLLGALLDAGADLTLVQASIEAVLPDSARLRLTSVRRAGLRAAKAEVDVLVDDPPHRTWSGIRLLLQQAELAEPVRDRALSVFTQLAEAEARVHGVAAGDVHFHEVGAIDSIADVVGVSAAMVDIGVESVSASAVALGSGWARTSHGRLALPVPAVAELSRGWQVLAGAQGECATPTGMALLRTLAPVCEPLPSMRLQEIGIGAGTRDSPETANVVRVLIGQPEVPAGTESVSLIEANVDDLDPRLWPGTLSALMASGADDAWLTPILMKKGRPAHQLSVLCAVGQERQLREVLFAHTSTLGVRVSPRTKHPMPRTLVRVSVLGSDVAVKIGHQQGRIVQVMPEFEDLAEVARGSGRPEREVLALAVQAAADSGLVLGALIGDR